MVFDIVLIVVGIVGFGVLIGVYLCVFNVVKFGGVVFLIGYGLFVVWWVW